MCGIAGILRFDDAPIARPRLDAMLRYLRHRGPDGEGVLVSGRCGLVHARLSIIDVAGGAQPMTARGSNGAGPVSTVFNGEIYNHRRLRQKLVKLGHGFATDHSDTEVLLHGYRQWREQMPRHLAGMFAFAVWDEQERKLLLARDRMGKKPLYLRWVRGADGKPRELMFASVVGALVAGLPAGESAAIDDEAMLTFLRLGYTGGRSMLRGIEELGPGQCLAVDAEGRAQTTSYWQPPPVSRSRTAQGVLMGVRESLEDAVARRLEADVPLGAFLSGGIDSSLICAIAQKQLTARGGDRLKTFCVRMPDAAYDESPYALAVAKHIGCVHTELLAEPGGDLVDDLARMVASWGEPTADSSVLPTYWVSRATRRHVKVALSGDGGDELFGGYDRYRAMRLLVRHRWWLSQVPETIFDSPQPRSAATRVRRLVNAARPEPPAEQYLRMIHLFTDEQITRLGFDIAPRARDLPPLGDWPADLDPAQAAMRWDLAHYLPQDLLRKVDRASMAVPLEVRCPMLDRLVVELACHLPEPVIMPGGRPKAILRDLAAELLPQEIVRRRKRGFAVPIGGWFRGPLREPLRDAVTGGWLGSIGINRLEAEQMIEEHEEGKADHSHRLFALLTMSLWAKWLKRPEAPAPL